MTFPCVAEDESELAVFSAKGWDRKSRVNLIECATPCNDDQLVGHYLISTLSASSEETISVQAFLF